MRTHHHKPGILLVGADGRTTLVCPQSEGGRTLMSVLEERLHSLD